MFGKIFILTIYRRFCFHRIMYIFYILMCAYTHKWRSRIDTEIIAVH
jgi:hypothetical protein